MMDRRGEFDRGGWVAPHFDEETGIFVTSVFERASSSLLSRTGGGGAEVTIEGDSSPSVPAIVTSRRKG